MSKLFRLMMAAGLIGALLGVLNGALVWAATPPEPTYGTAVVDGDYGEWNLAEDGSGDFFANMIKASGHGGQTNVLSKLYLRYDCSTNTLYALVLVEPAYEINTYCGNPEDPTDAEHFIKLGQDTTLVSCNDIDAGRFAWVGKSGDRAQGWEASTPLAPGSYSNLNVHTLVDADEENDTSGTHYSGTDLEIGCSPTCSIGDYVWHDANMNGLQDAGESGLDEVTVNLYDGSGNFLKDTTTSGGGYYIFDYLVPGDYQVGFVLPEDYNFSLQDQGGDDAVDSDADQTTGKTSIINLSAVETDLTWDAGLHLCAMGDRVWHDQDGHGDQNGTEPGFDNVKVYLYGSDPGTSCGDSGFLEMRTTGSGTSQTPEGYTDGIYIFDMADLGYPPGDYWVCVDESTLPNPPDGMIWARTTGPHTTGDNPQKVTYEGNDIFSIDFGYTAVAPGSIGDYVWDDGTTAKNNVQDATDTPIPNVYVYLYQDNAPIGQFGAEDGTPIMTDTTGADGKYLFTGLPAGNYIVRVEDSVGETFLNPVAQYYGTDRTIDSNSPLSTPYVEFVPLGAGENNLDIDFGYSLLPTAVTLSSFAARSSAGGSANLLRLGIAGLTVLAAGSLFWTKRRASL